MYTELHTAKLHFLHQKIQLLNTRFYKFVIGIIGKDSHQSIASTIKTENGRKLDVLFKNEDKEPESIMERRK
jgi:hypothetical protein